MAMKTLQALARAPPTAEDVASIKYRGVDEEKYLRHEARRQVEYYFPSENLDSDEYVYNGMGREKNKPVPLSLIMTFKEMRMFQKSSIVQALRESRDVKVVIRDGEDCIVRVRPYMRPQKREKPNDAQIEVDEIPKDAGEMLSNLLGDSFKIKNPSRRPPRDSRAMREAAEAGKGYIVGTSGNMKLIRTPRGAGPARDTRFRRFAGPRTALAPSEAGLHTSIYAAQAGEQAMTDYEYRRGSYRGGAGGGGYNDNRGKKRFREDDDDARPQYRYGRRETPAQKLRKMLLAVADNKMFVPAEEVMSIAREITDNYDDEICRERTSSLIVQLVQEQPFKIPFIAAVVLYTNRHKPEFLDVILSKTGLGIQAALDQGQWRSLKLLLRFLGSLQDVLEGGGIFTLLEELFNRAADLQSASTEDALGLELVKIIMLTIPYVIASSVTDLKEQVADLLGKTDIIASAPRETETIVDPFIRFDGAEAPRPQSYLGLLQKQLQNEAERGWPLTLIPRLFKPVTQNEEDLIDLQTETPDAGQRHGLPTITVPTPLHPGPQPLFPEIYFSVYADQDVETVPSTAHIAASLVRDVCVDNINILDFNRNAAARFLTEMDCYFTPGTFAKRITAFDKIKDLPEGASTWKPEDLAIDAIVSQIVQLPTPEHKIVYFHSLITETCKIAPGAIAPSLGRAIRYLYRTLDTLDQELVYRFVDWFSHHLSNFDFRWKWQEWINDVEEVKLNARKSFILAAVDKEMRLSFAKRIRSTVPQEYQKLIPASKDNDIPEFKYNNSLEPFSEEVKLLVRPLRKKKPEEEIQEILQQIRTKASAPESEFASDPELPVVDAFVTTICYIGSKTLSHILSYIERSRELLLTLSTSSPSARYQIVTSVIGYWSAVQPGVAVTIVDKLLNYTILTPSSVIEWALDSERLNGGRLLTESWIYEMITRTSEKVTNRVRQIVNARLQPGNSPEQVDMLESTLATERDSMRNLFATIDDALVAVADGSADQVLQGGPGMLEASEEERALLQLWGTKWRRVFARKLAVEESIIAEGAKNFPPAVEEQAVVNGGDVEMNGGDKDEEAKTNGDIDATGGEEVL